MVSLVRNGSRSIYITSKQIDLLTTFLKTRLNASEMDIQVIQDRSREYQTVVFVSDGLEKDKIVKSFLIHEEPVMVLASLISYKATDIIESIRPGANLVIMRALGDLDKVIRAVQRDLGGELISYSEYTKNDNSDYTIIALTEKPISRGIIASDFNKNFLMIKGEYGKIKRELRMQALHYLNFGIDNKDWNEIEIRIYDIYGAYNLHYDRMMEVFDDLEIGLVLGESWSKDYPKAMLSVQIYRVRFFTFKDPVALKRIVLGIEYLEDGMRVVDYDVYYKNEKIGWSQHLKRKERKNVSRKDEGIQAREDLLKKLNKDTIEELKILEGKIVASRY